MDKLDKKGKQKMIAVIDIGSGNLSSVANALKYLNAQYKITSKNEDIEQADKVIFPGVGNFGNAMSNLKKQGLIESIKKAISDKKPFLGICLGMQLLFDESEESPNKKGLVIFEGKVRKFKVGLKVPQIGWNQIKIKNGKVFKGIKGSPYMYFVHSYYAEPADKSIITATTDYGIDFASAIEKDNVFAVQFHPEKSGEVGLKILENFLKC